MAIRLTLVLISTALLLGGCGDGERPAGAVLKFTAIPLQNTTRLKEKFDPVARYLSQRLGIQVEYVPATNYSASVEMFRNGDVHLAWFGGLTGVQARRAVPGARAIVQGREDPKYFSYFIAHKDTGLKRGDGFPTAMKGMKFTFGSESSTSGRLMPEFFIRENTNGSPADFFGREPNFSGSHDKTCALVEAGTFQAGVVDYKVYERRVKEGTTDPDVCRIVWKTPNYADYNFTAHPDIEKLFGEGTIEKLQRALIEMNDENLLKACGRTGLIEAKNEDFEKIEDVAERLGMLR